METNRSFVFQQISDYGASNENVARLTLQTLELTKICSLKPDAKEQLILSVHEISHRLASAQNAALDLSTRVTAQTNAIQSGGNRGHERGIEIPYVPSLQILFEGYYYNLKNVVRDLGGIPMRVLYGKRFEEASSWLSFKENKEPEICKHLRRMESNHPGYSTVRELINRNQQNIKHIVSVRNALEQPGKLAGTIRVKNWSVEQQGITPPYFYYEHAPEQRYDLVGDMVAAHEAILTLAETLIVFGLIFYLPQGFGIQHIGPNRRDPKTPMAYRVIVLPPDVTKRSQPFTGKEE
ncbi:hypothetical protein [Rhizobium sp. AAP43]|uniref:hypothetical protein n=1 Tax=Rhizobium sp. AAP43 TaxID=1523420 RepID=UPI0006B9161D|nr:hypothetical protein [Rhizobium sp. AAP43]KPF47244.1 hypothetical protein IP76_00250 [Rhizobium sp. AAP43]